jgi:tetratricopeptide (TPR) repeat protein
VELGRAVPVICYLLPAIASLVFAQPPVSDLSLGTVLENAGQLDAARNIYLGVLRLDRFSPEAYERLKGLEFRTGGLERFIAFTDTLLRRHPGNPDLKTGKGEGLIRLGRKNQGAALLDELVRGEPEYARQVGGVYEANALSREAIQVYLGYRRRKNTPGIFAPNLMALYEKTGDYPAAAREAVTLLNVNPRLAGEYDRKFQFYAQKSAPASILSELGTLRDPALRADFRAKVLLAAGRTAEGLREIAQMNSPEQTLRFAQYAEQSDYLDAAAGLYAELSRPYDQARVLRKQGRLQEAAAMLELSSDPNARFELAELQRIEFRDFARAAENYGRVLGAIPGRVEAYAGRGECLMRMGRLDDARAALLAAPHRSDQVLFRLAQIAFFRGATDSAQFYGRELMRTSPQSDFVNDALELSLLVARGGDGLKSYARARLDFEQGRLDSAVALALTIIGSDTTWADQAYLLLADCYRLQRAPNQALGALDELEKNHPGSRFRARARYLRALVLQEDLKNESDYRRTMESVFNDFPESPYAALARNRLVPTSKPRE